MSIFFCRNFCPVQPVVFIANPINRFPLGGTQQPCIQVAIVVHIKHSLRFHLLPLLEIRTSLLLGMDMFQIIY